MRTSFPRGVYPTMITPFTADNRVDVPTLKPMLDWYIAAGVAGVFGVCQSSAMFELSLAERVMLASETVRAAAGRVPVLASGHVSDAFDDQVREIRDISATGIDAFVLVTNRLARQDESDEVWWAHLERLLAEIPAELPLGLYECPYPYKRLLSPELIARVAGTGRFHFVKDTCCDVEQIRAKIEATRGTALMLFNANAATLLASLQMGGAGYSGVMANSHPDLYVWLCNNFAAHPELASRVQDFLGIASVIENQLYPVNAKYYQQLEGLPIRLECRRADAVRFSSSQRLEVEQMRRVSKEYSKLIQGVR